jgi:hypothetical protein
MAIAALWGRRGARGKGSSWQGMARDRCYACPHTYDTSTNLKHYTRLKFESKTHFYGRAAAEENFSEFLRALLPGREPPVTSSAPRGHQRGHQRGLSGPLHAEHGASSHSCRHGCRSIELNIKNARGPSPSVVVAVLAGHLSSIIGQPGQWSELGFQQHSWSGSFQTQPPTCPTAMRRSPPRMQTTTMRSQRRRGAARSRNANRLRARSTPALLMWQSPMAPPRGAHRVLPRPPRTLPWMSSTSVASSSKSGCGYVSAAATRGAGRPYE